MGYTQINQLQIEWHLSIVQDVVIDNRYDSRHEFFHSLLVDLLRLSHFQ